MGGGLIFHLVCLACLTLTIAYDVPNEDIDCSSLVLCTRKTWAEKQGVCASDGKFYNTLCGFKVHRCESGEDIFPVLYTDDQNDCSSIMSSEGKRQRRDNHHRSRRASKHVILERIGWNIAANQHLGFFHPNISINVTFQTSTKGDTISGRGLWKAGLFRSRYEDGFGDRAGPYVQQLLNKQESSMKVRTGRPYYFTDLQTVYDLNEVGCSDFRYLCVEFSQGDNPRPSYTLTITSLTGSAVLCTEIPCYGRTGDGVDRSCRRPCPEDGEPVCGDDGVSYSSSCEIDNLVRCGSQDVRVAYAGECRIGVIMESMFWSAGVVSNEPGELTELEMEAFLFSNESSESVAGTDLWRMGVFGSMNVNGIGPKFGYVPQILDGKSASQTLVSGLPLPIRARFHFDVATIGCNEFNFLCMEFTRNTAAEPFFPFQTNSGRDVFTSCRAAPCDPLASLTRMAMGPVTWGLTVVTARRSSPSDISLDLMTQISPDSDVIRGRGLWRVGVFGSSSANGSSDERFNYVRQLLDPTQASLPVGPDTKLSFPVLPTQFDIMKLGCSKFKYICLEIAKGDDPQPDFVFHNDAQKPLIFCKSVACPGPPKPVVRLVSLDWGLRLLEHRIGNSSNVSVGVSIATSDRSSPLNGTGLWKLGFFVSENGSPETDATRGQYLEQILGEAASSTPVTPGMPLDFLNVQTAFDLTGMGCNGSEFNYICISFAKGESPDPDFDLPLRNDEAVSCKRISCQEGAGSDGPVAQYIRMGAAADIPSEGTELSATVDITAASSSERIDGDGLWRVGVFGSRDSNGGGRRNGEVRNILDRNSLRQSLVPGRDMRLSGTFDFPNTADLGCTSDYRYLCFEFAKGDRPSVRFTMQSNVMCREQTSCNSGGGNPGGSGNVARYTNLGADIGVRGTRVSADITVTPDSSTDQISGNGLWRVGAFGSTNAQGNGRKNGEVRNILDYFGQGKTLRRGSPMELSGSFNFPNAADLGCSNAYRYLCFEFDKGERPSVDFTMQSTIMCQERTCESGSSGGSGSTGGHGGRPTRPTGGSGSSGGSNDPKTVKIRGLAWALDGSSVEASVNLESNPSDFEGRFLWRMGAFASPSSTGEGRRYDETRQILANPDRSRSIRSGRPNTFTSSTGLDIRGLGCDEKRYLCLEFGQGPNPNPPFTIQNGDTREETKVACKIQQCNQEPQIRVNSVRPTAIEISEGQRNDVEFDVTVKYVTADTTSIRGSSLWKVQAWGAKTAGDVNPKVSVADQVLSSFQQDTMVEGSSGSSFNFQRVSHTFDMTGRKCPEMKFFCVRLQKDRPRPDFRLMARNDDPERLMGCMKVTCNGINTDMLSTSTPSRGIVDPIPPTPPSSNPYNSTAAAKPKFTATNIGIVRTPFSAARADRNNPVELDVQINYDRATTTSISGDPQWALEAWGSAKKNGKGRKISPSNLDLGYQGHQTFEEGGVLRFSSIPYNFDLTGQECQKSKFLCLRLTKTGAGFTLKGKPNSKALTKCAPYSCLPASGSPSGGGGGSVGAGGGGGGGGGGGNSQPVDVTINSFTANIDDYPVSETKVPITMSVQMGITPNSGVPSGPNLWHIAVYGNSRSDGSDPDKRGYTGNLLTPKQAKTRITPGSVTNINDIRFDFNMNGIGCHPYNYLCIEYGKGSSQKLNMVYPRDGLGVSCTVQRCPN